MAQDSVTIDLDATPDQVWAVVGDFEGIGSWFPGIESTRIEGDVRILGTMGMEIHEQLVERDDEGRVLVYSVIQGAPIESHRASVSVKGRGDGSTVDWLVEVEPPEMLPIFVDIYQKALEQIRDKVS